MNPAYTLYTCQPPAIHAIIQSANQAAAGERLKSCRYRSAASLHFSSVGLALHIRQNRETTVTSNVSLAVAWCCFGIFLTLSWEFHSHSSLWSLWTQKHRVAERGHGSTARLVGADRKSALTTPSTCVVSRSSLCTEAWQSIFVSLREDTVVKGDHSDNTWPAAAKLNLWHSWLDGDCDLNHNRRFGMCTCTIKAQLRMSWG